MNNLLAGSIPPMSRELLIFLYPHTTHQAWTLWNQKKITSLIDPVIAEHCYEADILRCIQVGLLCVQELAIDRPCISTVISMLEGDISDLPHPNKPGFTHISKDSEEDQQGSSINFISITNVAGR